MASEREHAAVHGTMVVCMESVTGSCPYHSDDCVYSRVVHGTVQSYAPSRTGTPSAPVLGVLMTYRYIARDIKQSESTMTSSFSNF